MSTDVHQAPPAASPDDVQVRDRRFWAATVDLWIVPGTLGVAVGAALARSVDAVAVGAVVAFPLLVAAEARTGRTPGKALTGLRTRRAGGGPVGWRRAALRRGWMVTPAVALLPGVPSAAGRVLLWAVLVGLVLSMGRSADGRGWHDRLGGTEVVPAPGAERVRPLAVVAGVAVAVLLLGVGWWFHTPATGSTSFRGMAGVDAVSCDVVHDGWLYRRQERTVTLTPGGGAFSGRFGPHDVTLELVDEPGDRRPRGLESRVATRSFGMTTGRSMGDDRRIVETTTGPGLGQLTIGCSPQAGNGT